MEEEKKESNIVSICHLCEDEIDSIEKEES